MLSMVTEQQGGKCCGSGMNEESSIQDEVERCGVEGKNTR